MKEITDIWFRTNLKLDTLAHKLDFKLEEFDNENIWEWAISSFNGVKLDICRNHTKIRSETFTNIFRIDKNKQPFSAELLEQIVSKLEVIGIKPIYAGKLWINKNEEFDYEIVKTFE